MTPFTHNKRKSMTPQRKAKVFAAHDGICHICGMKVRGDWDADHIIALENGGSDDDDNLAPACKSCHSDKTPGDHADAARARRRYTKHVAGVRGPKGRPMPGTKASGWKKKINGEVVRR